MKKPRNPGDISALRERWGDVAIWSTLWEEISAFGSARYKAGKHNGRLEAAHKLTKHLNKVGRSEKRAIDYVGENAANGIYVNRDELRRFLAKEIRP